MGSPCCARRAELSARARDAAKARLYDGARRGGREMGGPAEAILRHCEIIIDSLYRSRLVKQMLNLAGEGTFVSPMKKGAPFVPVTYEVPGTSTEPPYAASALGPPAPRAHSTSPPGASFAIKPSLRPRLLRLTPV